MFLRIIITPEIDALTPKQWGDRIACILHAGESDILHLRLPRMSEGYVREILENVPQQFINQITLHDFHNLALEGLAGGIHLNRRNPDIPDSTCNLRISKSCHSIEEVNVCNPEICSYVTLSPIFDSISKQGYQSAFSLELLKSILPNLKIPVVALGGVLRSHFPLLQHTGFSGGATLSDTMSLFQC